MDGKASRKHIKQDLMAKDAILEKGMVICSALSTVVDVNGLSTNLK